MTPAQPRRPKMHPLMLAAIGMALIPAAVVAYYGIWLVVYRLPPSPQKVVDLRSARQGKAYYVAFCSSLADNAFGGYPGHCFMLWATDFPIDVKKAESAGYVPRYFKDQIPSLFMPVTGLKVREAWVGNQENFTSLTAIVDGPGYEKSRHQRDSWNPDFFQVGKEDCVTFCHDMASAVGLKTPSDVYVYPQDFVRRLKDLN